MQDKVLRQGLHSLFAKGLAFPTRRKAPHPRSQRTAKADHGLFIREHIPSFETLPLAELKKRGGEFKKRAFQGRHPRQDLNSAVNELL